MRHTPRQWACGLRPYSCRIPVRLLDLHEFGDLISAQAGMLSRRQLTERGLRWDRVDHQIRAGRWVARTPRVISTVTGELSTEQRRWLAVLHAGPRSMLGGLTAAERFGLHRWEQENITVLVADELAFDPVEGIHFSRSRRSFEMLAHPGGGLPTCMLEPAILMWAGYDARNRAAHAVLAAAVQQRLTTAPDSSSGSIS